jgi:hypothetical protein
MFLVFNGLLPHFSTSTIFISFSYGLSGSNPWHYGFSNLNKLLTTLGSSFLFVSHTHYAYVFQILLVRLLKLFITL